MLAANFAKLRYFFKDSILRKSSNGFKAIIFSLGTFLSDCKTAEQNSRLGERKGRGSGG